jgi:hypothetical protein
VKVARHIIDNILTQDEVREIIKKRKNFEYGVARAGKEKVDFLRYIEYELNLDLLRRKRVERLSTWDLFTGTNTHWCAYLAGVFPPRYQDENWSRRYPPHHEFIYPCPQEI